MTVGKLGKLLTVVDPNRKFSWFSFWFKANNMK